MKRLSPRAQAVLLTLIWGLGLGALILGIGGRVAMRVIAVATTRTGAFSLGGTGTVVFLGLASGALAALILLVARYLFWRWRPVTTVVFWLVLTAITLRGLRPIDQLRLLTFLPLVALFGVVLQWLTFRYRRAIIC